MFINEEECRQILANYLKTTDFELLRYKTTNFQAQFQGLVGNHFTIAVEFKTKNQHQQTSFFLKTLSRNPFMLTICKELKSYEKETFFYKLLEEFAKFDIDTSFAPQCLFFKPYLIVLEDLSSTYKGMSRKHFFDYEQCLDCLTTLAKFHSASIIYEKKSGVILNEKFSEILQDPFENKNESFATKWLETAIQSIIALIPLLPESREDFIPKLTEFLSKDKPTSGSLLTILHGDLWTCNFLHQSTKAILLDYQFVKYGPIEKDVVDFLITCTTGEFRQSHFDSLLKFYYENLTKFLDNNRKLPEVSIFLKSCYTFRTSGRIRALLDQSFTFLDDEIYAVVMETDEAFRKFLYEDRSQFVLEGFEKNPGFRKTLSDGLLELQELL